MKVVIPVGSLETGGGCKVLVDIANALHDKGHDTEIVIRDRAPIVYDIKCKVTRVPELKKENIPYGDIVLPNFYTTFLPAFEAWPEQCVRLCQGFEPYWVPNPDFAIWTYNQNVPIISVSHWLDDQIFNHVGKRGRVVNLGIEPDIFNLGTSKEPKRERRKIILYIARDPKKGYALKGYNDFYRAMKLINGKYRGKFVVYMMCPETIMSLPGIANRSFVPKNPQEVARLYRLADVFVSSSWFEGFGLPPLEAMACGTPVVTTNSGGILDFCEHGRNAFITPPKNPRSLATGIVKVLKNRSLSNDLINQGLETAKQMNSDLFKQKIVKALENINLGKKRAAIKRKIKIKINNKG
jgi:glycosyltransferase involved in cell wall biosynthesis